MENKTCGECRWYDYHHLLCVVGGDVKPTDCACDSFISIRLTKGDKIRQMSDGALAFMMTRLILDGCPISGAKTIEDMEACKVSTDCTNCLKQLLNQEAKDE